MSSESFDDARDGEASMPLYDETIFPSPDFIGGQRLQLRAEQLTPVKQSRQAQRAVITRRAVAEKKLVEVEVWHEEFFVDYVDGDGSAMLEEGSETIVVLLRAEEIEIVKRLRVVEEVHITKRTVIEQQRLSGSVRHEVLHVDESSVRRESSITGAQPS